ncbi:hypothetical protein T484DRAFT_1671258, partial [Baffinella frigidus]
MMAQNMIIGAKDGVTSDVRRLLAGGADVMAVNNIGITALHEAASEGHDGVAKVLILAAAN